MNANLLAVKDAYDSTSRGDFDKLIGLLVPGIRWRVTGPDLLAGEYTDGSCLRGEGRESEDRRFSVLDTGAETQFQLICHYTGRCDRGNYPEHFVVIPELRRHQNPLRPGAEFADCFRSSCVDLFDP